MNLRRQPKPRRPLPAPAQSGLLQVGEALRRVWLAEDATRVAVRRAEVAEAQVAYLTGRVTDLARHVVVLEQQLKAVPAPSVCQTCRGDQVIAADLLHPQRLQPCPGCCCGISRRAD